MTKIKANRKMNKNRGSKLFEKLLTQQGFRMSNAWEREQKRQERINNNKKS